MSGGAEVTGIESREVNRENCVISIEQQEPPMPDYKTPIRDMVFVRNELLDFPALWQRLPGCEEASEDLAGAI